MDQAERGSQGDVTVLLQAWRAGDEAALGQLLPLVERELRRIARSRMRAQRAGHTLQATALVNEAYLRLVDLSRIHWRDRVHFLSMAARLMRQILVDSARARGSQKRGAAIKMVTLTEEGVPSTSPPEDLLDIDAALSRLDEIAHRKAQIVELRFFGGLTVEETAEALQISVETVHRDWRFARAWLMRALTSPGNS
jgi:RNA polymerase sigma factor (TIGR02999 family)